MAIQPPGENCLDEVRIDGEPHHDLQVEKTITFDEFVRLLNEWKEAYVNE